MTKEERLEWLRYTVWLYNHRPEAIQKSGYKFVPNRDGLEPGVCKDCKQPFMREVGWQRRCDNCITYYETWSSVDRDPSLDIKELSVGGGLGVSESSAPRHGSVGRQPRPGANLLGACKKCGGNQYTPTPGCSGCFSYKQVDRALPVKG